MELLGSPTAGSQSFCLLNGRRQELEFKPCNNLDLVLALLQIKVNHRPDSKWVPWTVRHIGDAMQRDECSSICIIILTYSLGLNYCILLPCFGAAIFSHFQNAKKKLDSFS